MPDQQPEVRLKEETLKHMQGMMREAVREGIKDLVTPETMQQFWGSGFQLLQEQATQRAGRMVLGGLVGLLKKASLFIVLGGIVYAVGGWGALAALVKALLPDGSGS